MVKAKIYEIDRQGTKKTGGVSVTCDFNPYEYSVSKSNSWVYTSKNRKDAPDAEFKKAGEQTLKLSLFFDTFEEQEKDVSKTTELLWKLMESKTRKQGKKNKKVPPPEVAFEWGVFFFRAVITQMTQQFTLFLANGTPVRAKVDATFAQYKDFKDYRRQNPTSGGGPIAQVWPVVAGDRLDIIAAEVYGDPRDWRRIAEHNGIINPMQVRAGQRLEIPLD